jgi:nitronate monooxygenase
MNEHCPSDLAARARAAGLAPLRLRGREWLPVVQGGMGVGVSAHRLAGSVAACGAVGTLSSVCERWPRTASIRW